MIGNSSAPMVVKPMVKLGFLLPTKKSYRANKVEIARPCSEGKRIGFYENEATSKNLLSEVRIKIIHTNRLVEHPLLVVLEGGLQRPHRGDGPQVDPRLVQLDVQLAKG